MHDEWHRVASEYAAQRTQDHLVKVLKLADRNLEAINSKIVDIHNRAAELGVTDLALKLSSLSAEDMFNIALGQTRDGVLSSERNGRPADDSASLVRTS
jgi:hypothetical protein